MYFGELKSSEPEISGQLEAILRADCDRSLFSR